MSRFLGQFRAGTTRYLPSFVTVDTDHAQKVHHCLVDLARLDFSIAYGKTEAYDPMRGQAPGHFRVLHMVPTCRDGIPNIPDSVRTHYPIHGTGDDF